MQHAKSNTKLVVYVDEWVLFKSNENIKEKITNHGCKNVPSMKV